MSVEQLVPSTKPAAVESCFEQCEGLLTDDARQGYRWTSNLAEDLYWRSKSPGNGYGSQSEGGASATESILYEKCHEAGISAADFGLAWQETNFVLAGERAEQTAKCRTDMPYSEKKQRMVNILKAFREEVRDARRA